jgi:secreted trypsin-like serine protease
MFGSVIVPHSKPWVVGLTDKIGGKIRCGGVLITRTHVLTAGHCMRSKRRRYVVVGEHDQKNIHDGQEYLRIKKNYIHPYYDKQKGISSFDLAILVLEKRLDFDNNVNKVNLPFVNESCENLSVNVSGWGLYEPRDSRHSSIQLRSVEINCLSSRSCSVSNYSASFNYKTMICGGNLKNPRHGACMGDSGGESNMYFGSEYEFQNDIFAILSVPLIKILPQ